MSTAAVLFGKGAVLGLSIAAPVGPMALLCFRATLAQGFRVGALAGLGIAAGDVFYATLAAFGLQAASALLTGGQGWLGLLGGVYLLWFGLSTALRPPAVRPAEAGPARGLATFATTFLLTLANPPTVMIFAAMFAGLGLAEAQGGSWPALAVVGGVLVGSGGWWLLFAGVVSRLRERVRGPLLAWMNRLSGAALAAFGAWAVAGAVGALRG
jgi:threonine/homoserine/homoserine lactone efflux protein